MLVDGQSRTFSQEGRAGIMKLLLIVTCFVAAAVADRTRYDGFSQVVATPTSRDQLIVLDKLYNRHKEIIFWDPPNRVGLEVAMLVPPQLWPTFATQLRKSAINFHVEIENIQKTLDEDFARLEARYAKNNLDYDPNDYNNFDSIIGEVERLASDECPTGFTCETYSIGQSVEGRELTMLSIVGSGSGRRAIWWDSLIHAREWLNGATVMNLVTKLMTEYGNDADATHILDNYDLYYLPIHNPDGYVYSWDSNRMWRKSRNVNPASACMGTDLNRNYMYLWGTGGSSTNPCSETFLGSAAGSEPEVAAAQNEMRRLSGMTEIAFGHSWHTYGQYYLIPYGAPEGSSCKRADDHADMMAVANAASDAIENSFGTNWARGTVCEVLYAASGLTVDFMKFEANIKYAFTPELRGGSFAPPASAITPSTTEQWNGLVALVNEVESREGWNKK